MKLLAKCLLSLRVSVSVLTLCSLLLSALPQQALAVNDTRETPFLGRNGPFDLNAPSADSSGGASYSIPIVSPPGRNGIQPSLALSYSSSNTDNTSPFGYGWNVVIPSITRINKEGMEKLYTQNDFSSSLDGELVFLSGTTIKTFAPKYESGNFNTYTFNTSTNIWTVTDKSGTVFSFGTTAASRQDNPTIPSQVYSWNLDRVEDANGNYETFTYFKDAGQIYPDKIYYTGNTGVATQFEVSFVRESRTDIVPSYRSGFSIKSNFRIRQVLVKAMGAWVRKYDLAYTTGANNVRSVLSSVTESARDANGNVSVLPAVLLEYQKPTISFTQASWTLPIPTVDSAVAGDNGSRFADVNGDGLVDIIKSKGNLQSCADRSVWINNGAGWTQNTSFTIDPTACFVIDNAAGYADFGLRAGDVNGDGKDDLIHAFQEGNNNSITTYKRVFLNSGTGFTLNSTIAVPNTYHFAGWYYGTNPGTNPTDVNADGRADLMIDGITGYYYGNGVSNGWSVMTSNPNPAGFSYLTYQLGDFNADGLSDTINYYKDLNTNIETKVVGLRTSAGEVASAQVPPTIMADNYGVDYGVRTVDINGDGLTDLVKSHQFVQNNQTYVTNDSWINTGTGFQQTAITLPSDVNFSAFITNIGYRDSGWRILDVNGDGMSDIVGSKPNPYPQNGTQYSRVYLNTSTKSDLLKKVTIPQGGTITYTYKTSLQYKDSSNNLVNTGAPYPVTTLDTVTTSDGSTSDTKTYFYEGASQYFGNYNDKQFAGFNIITETDSAGNKTKTYYHQGNTTDTARGEVSDHPAKIGRVYRTERYNASGNLMSAQVNAWDSAALSSGRFLVTNSRSTTLTYEGDASHKDTATTYTYDVNGNVLTKSEYGEVTANTDGTFTDVGTDLRTTVYTYATSVSNIVKNKVSQSQLNDSVGALVSQTQYLYDALPFGQVNKGNATSIKKYISAGVYATTTNAYSTEGLVTSTTNPRGYATTYTYDTYKLYPLTETNALGHVTTRAWNYAIGKEKTVTDANSQVTQTDYDGLGRVVAVSATDPYTFSLTPLSQTTYFDYRNAFSDYTQKFINSNLSQDTYNYYDPLGRKIQTRTSHEDGNFATADTIYTRDNLVLKQSLPYYSTGSAKTSTTGNTNLFTTFGYDSLNRVTASTNVLGTTTTIYGDWSRTVADALGNKKDVFTDAFGNIAKVNEYPTSTAVPTTYQYNAQNLLTKITDGAGNIRNFSYSPRGERTLAEDLHNPSDTTFATTTNTYDVNGNVLTEVRGGSTTNYVYDELDRVTSEDSDSTANVDVAYTYDDTAQTVNGKGRLTKTRRLVDASNSNWSYFYYLRNGLVYQDSKSIFSGGSFLTKYSYDTAGNVTKLTTPDNAEVKYTYNSLNKTEKVERKEVADASYSPVVFDFDYGPHGNVVFKANANNTHTFYTYDANELYRLKNISTIDPPLEVPEGETAEVPVVTEVITVPPVDPTPTAPAVEASVPDTTSQQSIPVETASGIKEEAAPIVEVPAADESSFSETTKDKDEVEAPAQTASVLESATEVIEAIQKKALEVVEDLLPSEDDTTEKNAEDVKKEMPVLAEDTTPPPAEEPPVVSETGKVLVEDEHLRTESSETYVVAKDGDIETRITRLYPMPIHIQDEDTGEWKEVDQNFSSENGELTIDKGTYELDIPEGDTGELATVTVGQLEVTLESDTQSSVPSEAAVVDNGAAANNVAEVEDAVSKDINIKLEADSNRIAKNVIIENKEALVNLKKVDDYYEIPFDLGVPAGTKLFVDGVEATESVVADRAELRLGEDSLYIMPGQAHDATMDRTLVQFAFDRNTDGSFTLTKRLNAAWMESATFPVTTDAVFSPYADIADGSILSMYPTSATWTQIRDAANGYAMQTSGNLLAGTYNSGSNGVGGFVFGVDRAHLSFDTSGLPDTADITAATIKVFAMERYQSYWYGIPSSLVATASTRTSPTNLTLADYSKVGAVKLSTEIPYSSLVSSGYQPISLNTQGLATISKTGWSNFALRTTHDTDNVIPYGIFRFQFASTETAGTTQDPFIEITYNVVTLPARVSALTVDGQANPTYITSAQPKFAATYNDTDDVDTAIAYRIQVIKDGGDFNSPLWDSQKTSFATAVNQGARTPDITYGGTALPMDGQKYKWRMQVWDFGNIVGPWSSGTDSFTAAVPVTVQYDLHTDCISAQVGRLDPTGLKCGSPVFAAKYTGTNPVNKYRLQVSTAPDFATNVWDTGATGIPMQTVTTGNRTQDIVYGGSPLKFDGTRYYWRIQYADASNVWSAWSATASFTTFTSRVYQNLLYGYDAVGNPLSIVDGSDLPTAKKTLYTYDPLYRLLSATATTLANAPIYTTTYTYDTIGNLASASDVGTYTYAGTGNASPNAPTSVGANTYSYDAKGNMTSDGTKTLNYFYDNLLSSVVNGGVTTSYNYFADKSRATVSTPTLATYYASKFFNQDSTGKKIKHIYSGSEDVATVENDGGIVTPFFNHDDALGSASVTTSNIEQYNRPPTISLYGASRVILSVGDVYTEQNAKAEDTEDGTISVTKTGAVNTATAGTYFLTYTATDSGGLTASVIRSVVVRPVNPADTMPTPAVRWTFTGAQGSATKLQNTGTQSGFTLTGTYTSTNGASGTDTAITLTPPQSLSSAAYNFGSNNFTIAFKVKDWLGNNPAYSSRTLFYQGTGPNAGIHIYKRYDGGIVCEVNGQSTIAWAGPSGWFDVACVKNGSSMSIYVNGSNYGGGSATTLAAAPSAIFGAGPNNQPFNGSLDDFRIYDSALTWQQVPAIFAALSNNPPVLQLNGDQTQVVTQNATYTELGATATDAEDGAITPTITGSINTANLGTQTLTYTATDSGGYAVKQTRSVTVVRPGPLTPNEVQAIDYLPFGKMRTNTQVGTSGFNEQKKFTGYEYDESSGLSYANARYYDQDRGLFTSQDPVSLRVGTKDFTEKFGRPQNSFLVDPQQLNVYSYGKNNPLKYTDEKGEAIQAAPYVIAGGVGGIAGLGGQYIYDVATSRQAGTPFPQALIPTGGIQDPKQRTVANISKEYARSGAEGAITAVAGVTGVIRAVVVAGVTSVGFDYAQDKEIDYTSAGVKAATVGFGGAILSPVSSTAGRWPSVSSVSLFTGKHTQNALRIETMQSLIQITVPVYQNSQTQNPQSSTQQKLQNITSKP